MITTGIYTFISHQYKVKYDFDYLAMLSLSVLKSQRLFENLELFCDENTRKLLDDVIGLPFNSYHIVKPDYISSTYGHMWSINKLRSYSSMEKPFLHIDNDVIIRSPLDTTLLNGRLIAQSYYDSSVSGLSLNIPYTPQFLKESKLRGCYNAGIMGGTDCYFFKELFELSKSILTDKKNHLLASKYSNMFNIFLEEVCFAGLAELREIKITSLFDDYATEEESVRLSYTHLAGNMKNENKWKQRVRARLLTEHEDFYRKLVSVCHQLYIPISNI